MQWPQPCLPVQATVRSGHGAQNVPSCWGLARASKLQLSLHGRSCLWGFFTVFLPAAIIPWGGCFWGADVALVAPAQSGIDGSWSTHQPCYWDFLYCPSPEDTASLRVWLCMSLPYQHPLDVQIQSSPVESKGLLPGLPGLFIYCRARQEQHRRETKERNTGGTRAYLINLSVINQAAQGPRSLCPCNSSPGFTVLWCQTSKSFSWVANRT